MALEEVMPWHSEFQAAGFRLYTLNVGRALGGPDAEQSLTVVLCRQEGLLLALPELAISADFLDVGNQEDAQGLVGPSTRAEVVCAAFDEDAIALAPTPVEGPTLTVLLVDFSNDMLQFLDVLRDRDLLDSTHPFEMLDPFMVPHGPDLVARALAWAGLGWWQHASWTSPFIDRGLFSARSIATASRPRPFAPTVNQRWVTTALQVPQGNGCYSGPTAGGDRWKKPVSKVKSRAISKDHTKEEGKRKRQRQEPVRYTEPRRGGLNLGPDGWFEQEITFPENLLIYDSRELTPSFWIFSYPLEHSRRSNSRERERFAYPSQLLHH